MGTKCRRCGYGFWSAGTWYCQYILLEGHRRPCPPGVLCTERQTQAAVRQRLGAVMTKPILVTDNTVTAELTKAKLRKIHEAASAGISAEEIAKQMGMTRMAVVKGMGCEG